MVDNGGGIVLLLSIHKSSKELSKRAISSCQSNQEITAGWPPVTLRCVRIVIAPLSVSLARSLLRDKKATLTIHQPPLRGATVLLRCTYPPRSSHRRNYESTSTHSSSVSTVSTVGIIVSRRPRRCCSRLIYPVPALGTPFFFVWWGGGRRGIF